MAHCCFSLVASLVTFFTTIMYLAAFGADWWVLTTKNRANLFSYTLSTEVGPNEFSEISYDWTFMCSNPDCVDCNGFTAESGMCDSRPAGVSCPGLNSPNNWCHVMLFEQCQLMFFDSCKESAREFYDDNVDYAEFLRGCSKVTDVTGACRHAQNCAAMIGVAMGFGILTSALAIVVWILSCRKKRSKHARRWAMAVTALLFVEFVFGVTGFSLGYIWTEELPGTDYRPGLWCSLVAFIANILAFLFFLLVAALNDSKDEPVKGQVAGGNLDTNQ